MNTSIYTFEGQDRLAFDFFRNSPTPTGLLLVYATCLFLTIFKYIWDKRILPMRIVTFASYGACVIGVALTYSRGAMCALLGVLSICATLIRKHERRWLGAIALITVALFCAVPSGSKRLLSSMELRTDRSIANRLLLWEGVCRSIVHRFPKAGGNDSVGREYQKYWQPLDQHHFYSTAVNLWLTIYSCAGIFIFCIVSWGYFFLVYNAWCAAKKTSKAIATLACFVLIAFGVNNLFSTITDMLIILVVFVAALSSLFIAKPPNCDRIFVRDTVKRLSVSLALALVVSTIPFIVTWIKPMGFHLRCEALRHNENPHVLEWFDTTAIQPKGVLLVWLGSDGEEENISAGRLARAACLQGLDAVLVPPAADGEVIMEYRIKEYKHGGNIYYAGIGPGAARALDKTMTTFHQRKGIGGLILTCPEGRSPLLQKMTTLDINIPVVFLNEDDNFIIIND
jgi:hypothetical protein